MTDREKYFDMRRNVKEIAVWLKENKKRVKEQESKKELDANLFVQVQRQRDYARHLNIVYGLLRGNTYEQMERKTRENNKPNKYLMESIIKMYELEGIVQWPASK